MVYYVLFKGSSLRQVDSRIRESFREKLSIYEMETSLFNPILNITLIRRTLWNKD